VYCWVSCLNPTYGSFFGFIVGFPYVNPTYGSFFGFIVGFPYVYRLDKEKAIEDFRQAAELFRQQGNAPAREKALQFLRQLGAV
jgi:hypothetical protein